MKQSKTKNKLSVMLIAVFVISITSVLVFYLFWLFVILRYIQSIGTSQKKANTILGDLQFRQSTLMLVSMSLSLLPKRMLMR